MRRYVCNAEGWLRSGAVIDAPQRAGRAGLRGLARGPAPRGRAGAGAGGVPGDPAPRAAPPAAPRAGPPPGGRVGELSEVGGRWAGRASPPAPGAAAPTTAIWTR